VKFFQKMTDGGPDSNSVGYMLCEIKPLFSIGLLKFTGKTREVFHEHAFHCLGWVLKGVIEETMIDGRKFKHTPSLLPFLVSRRDFHQVNCLSGTAWVFTIRGPWKSKWREATQDRTEQYELTNGRVRV
jgi:hypothetical protein